VGLACTKSQRLGVARHRETRTSKVLSDLHNPERRPVQKDFNRGVGGGVGLYSSVSTRERTMRGKSASLFREAGEPLRKKGSFSEEGLYETRTRAVQVDVPREQDKKSGE